MVTCENESKLDVPKKRFLTSPSQNELTDKKRTVSLGYDLKIHFRIIRHEDRTRDAVRKWNWKVASGSRHFPSGGPTCRASCNEVILPRIELQPLYTHVFVVIFEPACATTLVRDSYVAPILVHAPSFLLHLRRDENLR